jgi:hypothetical protein
MKKQKLTQNTLSTLLLSFIVSMVGFVSLSIMDEGIQKDIVFGISVVTFFLGIGSGLYLSMLIQSIDFQSSEDLRKAEKEYWDQYDEDALFIDALKLVILKREIPIEDIEKEKEKLKNK